MGHDGLRRATHAGNGPDDDTDSFITPFTVRKAAPRASSRFFFARFRQTERETQMITKRRIEPATPNPTTAITGMLVSPTFASVISPRLESCMLGAMLKRGGVVKCSLECFSTRSVL